MIKPIENDYEVNEKKNILIAFSGGSDSMFLLHYLISMNYNPILLHLQHGLRDSQEEELEAEFVRAISREIGSGDQSQQYRPRRQYESMESYGH